MKNTAAHLVDHIIAPDLTLRQCVLTVPFELRLLLAAKPEALSAIGRIFVQEISAGSASWLEQHGFLRSEQDEDPAENAAATSPWMRCLQGSLGVAELRRWAEHGSTEQRRNPARDHSLPKPTKGLSAEHLRFNLHAGVSVPGGLPTARERLLRYCARPPLALERLSVLDDGRICYRIKDTDQARLMTPVQLLARLAALVPPPRHPLARFYGVWAPHSQWRSRVITAPPAKKTRVTSATSITTDSCPTLVTPARLSNVDASGTAAPPPTPDGAQGYVVSASLRHRPPRVPELRRTDALRRSDLKWTAFTRLGRLKFPELARQTPGSTCCR